MLVVMQAHATDEQVRAVCRKIESLGYRAHPMPGAQRTAVCVTGNRGEVEAGTLEEMAGVQELIRVSKPYKLVSRDFKEENTIITEAIDNESIELVEQYADVVQIGARNMQNFSLLKRAGRCKKPVMVKRGMSATLEEFLMAAEYVMSEGNYNVILCERGVRTFADHTRNTLDLSVVPAVQRLSHLPIVVDPSHGTGKRNKVTPLSRAAIAVGADGLLIE